MDLTRNPILSWISNVGKFGLEYAAGRYYGLYGGIVDDNADPQAQARIKVKVPSLGHGRRDAAGNFTAETHDRYAYPSSIYAGQDHGIYFPPEIGDAVYVSFDHGDHEVPRYHGSWWCNPGSAKAEATSHVPAEFRSASSPTKRGIKTKFGHGLIFSDTEAEPYVQLWSGQQLGPGEEAVKRQRVTLSDREGDAGIYLDTFDGRRLHVNDTEFKVTLSGKASDPAGAIANSITIEDMPPKLTIKTNNPVPQTITLDGTTGNIDILSPAIINITALGAANVTATGALTMSAAGGIAMGSGAAPPAPSAPGVAVETGAGAKIINFAGAVTETLAAFTQTAATVIINAATSFTVNAPTVSIGPPGFGISLLGGFITIGNPVIATRAMQEEIMTWLETHTHTGNLGAPTPVTPTFITGTPASLYDPTNPTQRNPIYVTDTKIS